MSSFMKLTIFAFLLVIIDAKQCITVRGRVECPVDPYLVNQILVRLADEDTGRPDDPMDEGYASSSGAFELYGCASDPIGTIDPILKIYHKCKGNAKRTTLIVPQSSVGGVHNYTQPINLLAIQENEDDHDYHIPKCSAAAATARNSRRNRRRFFFL